MIKTASLLPGNRQGTPGQRGTQRRRRHRGSPAPGLQGFNVDCSGRSGKTIKGENKAGEYLAYPRVLRPLLSIMHCMKWKWEAIYSGMQGRNQNKGKKLGLSKTSIFQRVLQHEERIANSLYK